MKPRGVNKPKCDQKTDDHRRENQRQKEEVSISVWKIHNQGRLHWQMKPLQGWARAYRAAGNWHQDKLLCWIFLQIAAYEREIGKLREELLKEIGHLEERKEEAVRAAANCTPEHFQNLQDQFFSKSAIQATKNCLDSFADDQLARKKPLSHV